MESKFFSNALLPLKRVLFVHSWFNVDNYGWSLIVFVIVFKILENGKQQNILLNYAYFMEIKLTDAKSIHKHLPGCCMTCWESLQPCVMSSVRWFVQSLRSHPSFLYNTHTSPDPIIMNLLSSNTTNVNSTTSLKYLILDFMMFIDILECH